MCAASARGEAGGLSTTDRGPLSLLLLLLPHSSRAAARRCWPTGRSFFACVSAQRMRAPKSITCLLCERSPRSSHTVFFHALVLGFLETALVLPLLYFTVAYRAIVKGWEPQRLRGSKETSSSLIFVW